MGAGITRRAMCAGHIDVVGRVSCGSRLQAASSAIALSTHTHNPVGCAGSPVFLLTFLPPCVLEMVCPPPVILPPLRTRPKPGEQGYCDGLGVRLVRVVRVFGLFFIQKKKKKKP
jgi:hypothetical protein